MWQNVEVWRQETQGGMSCLYACQLMCMAEVQLP